MLHILLPWNIFRSCWLLFTDNGGGDDGDDYYYDYDYDDSDDGASYSNSVKAEQLIPALNNCNQGQ